MKRIVIVCAAIIGAVFVVRTAVSTMRWYGCTQDGAGAVLLSINHLGAPPSVLECAVYQLARPAAEALGEISAPPPTTEPPPLETNADGSPVLYPNGDGTFHDSRWGKTDCAHDGCTTYGQCPLGYPPASHFVCTTPTIPPEQWPQSP